eukprot:30918-Pelagococcus_subviridis.AAC.20
MRETRCLLSREVRRTTTLERAGLFPEGRRRRPRAVRPVSRASARFPTRKREAAGKLTTKTCNR